MSSRAYMVTWILSSVFAWVPITFSLISAFPFFRFSVVGSLVAKNDLQSLSNNVFLLLFCNEI